MLYFSLTRHKWKRKTISIPLCILHNEKKEYFVTMLIHKTGKRQWYIKTSRNIYKKKCIEYWFFNYNMWLKGKSFNNIWFRYQILKKTAQFQKPKRFNTSFLKVYFSLKNVNDSWKKILLLLFPRESHRLWLHSNFLLL